MEYVQITPGINAADGLDQDNEMKLAVEDSGEFNTHNGASVELWLTLTQVRGLRDHLSGILDANKDSPIDGLVNKA